MDVCLRPLVLFLIRDVYTQIEMRVYAVPESSKRKCVEIRSILFSTGAIVTRV